MLYQMCFGTQNRDTHETRRNYRICAEPKYAIFIDHILSIAGDTFPNLPGHWLVVDLAYVDVVDNLMRHLDSLLDGLVACPRHGLLRVPLCGVENK